MSHSDERSRSEEISPHILNRLDMRIPQVVPKTYHTYSKIWVNRDSASRFFGFFGDFWCHEPDLYSEFSEFQIRVFSATFLQEITLYVIDM